MHTFRDSRGRTWEVIINVWKVKRVRGVVSLDLLSLVDDRFEGLNNLLADPVKLIDMLYVLCEVQAKELGVTDEDFGAAFAGDTLWDAGQAFLSELVDFFPDARARDALKRVIEKTRAVHGQLLNLAMENLGEADDREEAEKLWKSLTNSPDSSASIRGPSPSES